ASSRAWSPFLGIGAGLQYSFDEHWGAMVELRRNFAHLGRGDFNGVADPGRTVGTSIAAIGLTYTFDKPARPAPVRAAQYTPPPEPVVAPPPPPPPVVAPPSPPPKPQFTVERMTFSASELFEFNSANLRTPAPKLDEFAAGLRGQDAGTVRINGYTDRIG